MKELRAAPEKQIALVFQGGGSLGAYEAGAYKGIYEFLRNRESAEGITGRNIFDIIAGTSIGAMNAAVLVSYVVEKGTYEGSVEKLIEFWEYMSKESIVETNPFFRPFWDYSHSVNNRIATGEAARRYYSSKEFAIFGVPTVFTPFIPAIDYRFFDPNNIWFRYDNEPLKRSLERFAKFPISTSYDDNQPRLILTTVDVADGFPVTFDSYPKEDGHRKTEYGKFVRVDNRPIGREHVIQYDTGITSDHVMASGSFPINYDYANLEVNSYDPNTNDSSNFYKQETRNFWDGGIMTNTPVSQMIMLHRYYWRKVRGLKDKAPSLGIAVINVHPTIQPQIPIDHDGQINRREDISYSDRSQKEEEILLLISDYMDLAEHLIRVAKDSGAKEQVINDLLNSGCRYHGLFSNPRNYRDILETRFDVGEIIRIERKNDENTISSKTYDFSSGTIKRLLEAGYNDAHDELTEFSKKKNMEQRQDEV